VTIWARADLCIEAVPFRFWPAVDGEMFGTSRRFKVLRRIPAEWDGLCQNAAALDHARPAVARDRQRRVERALGTELGLGRKRVMQLRQRIQNNRYETLPTQRMDGQTMPSRVTPCGLI